MRLAMLVLPVADHDAAIEGFRDMLGFRLIEDARISPEQRSVVIAPPKNEGSSSGARLRLARAAGSEQKARIGDQPGGRVFSLSGYGRLRSRLWGLHGRRL